MYRLLSTAPLAVLPLGNNIIATKVITEMWRCNDVTKMEVKMVEKHEQAAQVQDKHP